MDTSAFTCGDFNIYLSAAQQGHGGLVTAVRSGLLTGVFSTAVCSRIFVVQGMLDKKAFVLVNLHAPVADAPQEAHEDFATQLQATLLRLGHGE
eukprot:186187-Amphidinium_carterae.1